MEKITSEIKFASTPGKDTKRGVNVQNAVKSLINEDIDQKKERAWDNAENIKNLNDPFYIALSKILIRKRMGEEFAALLTLGEKRKKIVVILDHKRNTKQCEEKKRYFCACTSKYRKIQKDGIDEYHFTHLPTFYNGRYPIYTIKII